MTGNRVVRRIASGAGAGLICLIGATLSARSEAQERPRRTADAPEEKRFDSSEFLEALRRRGLVDLLELYLKEYPPRNPESRATLDQEVLRARFADRSRPIADRMAALQQANALLEQLIRDKPRDARALGWRADLAYSLVFDEGEAAAVALLYRGGSAEEQATLRTVTERALVLLDELRTLLSAEKDRLNHLSLAEYEQLERTGHVERLERSIIPRTDYTWWWALYYNALSRPPDDPERKKKLDTLIAGLSDKPDWTAPGSPLEVSCLLLSGMAQRLRGETSAALSSLTGAQQAIAARPPQEQATWAWAEFLSTLEQIRALRDSGRFDDALIALDQRRLRKPAVSTAAAGEGVVLALCERSVHLARAAEARKQGRSELGAQYQTQASACLFRLIRENPGLRESLYAALYAQLGPRASVDDLDSVEIAALVAGLLGEAESLSRAADSAISESEKPDLSRRARERFEQAANIAERASAADPVVAADALPEIIFNGAVAAYRSGRIGKAGLGLLRVARDFPTFPEASRAAVLAVQVTSTLYREAGADQRLAAREVHLEALSVLMSRYASDPAAKYWRFFYAQALEEGGRLRDAANQYLLVDADHPHGLEAMFLHWRCLAEHLSSTPSPPDAEGSAQRRIREIVEGLRVFHARAEQALKSDPDRERSARLREFVVESEIIPLELALADETGKRPATEAFETVEALTAEFPKLRARVLRARLLLLAESDRLDEFTRKLTEFLTISPPGAGRTLQEIYVKLMSGWEPVESPVADDAQRRRAEAAVTVAERLLLWSADAADLSEKDRAVLLLQRGEAELAGGDYRAAVQTFERAGGAKPMEGGGDSRARLGLAEARFAAGDFSGALPVFNELARLEYEPNGEAAHWRALLRDLQCRLALGQNPRDVLKVIENRRASAPDLGGPRFSAAFEKLRRECLHRLNPATAAP